MKVLPNPNAGPGAEVPEVEATPIVTRRGETARGEVVPVRPAISSAESAAIYSVPA